MLKKLLLGTVLLSTSLLSQAGYIKDITGADMSGLEVTATFANSDTETFSWSTLTTNLGSVVSGQGAGVDNIINHEGFSGGVFGTDWSLTQQGYTLANFDGPTIYGAWSFTDNTTTNAITSLEINGVSAGIVFDTLFLTDLSLDTNGSGQGRPFFAYAGGSEYTDASATYTNNVEEEIFSSLTIDLASPGTSFNFIADTDKVSVSEPATALVFLTGLLALVNIRRNKV